MKEKKLLKVEFGEKIEEQSKHNVSDILENSRYDLVKSYICSKKSLEKSSFSLVKKLTKNRK